MMPFTCAEKCQRPSGGDEGLLAAFALAIGWHLVPQLGESVQDDVEQGVGGPGDGVDGGKPRLAAVETRAQANT